MSAAGPPRPTLGAVLLTMGDRPAELARAIESIRAQRGAPIEVVVVANGGPVPQAGPGVGVVALPENVGLPAGRNAGWQALPDGVDVILFVDDDGELGGDGVGERLRALFAADPRLGIVSFRIADPATGASQRRHVPRLRAGDPARSSEVTTFLGGACAIRRAVFRQVGPLPAGFVWAHEETDLAWRALDAGWRIRYDAACVLAHPASSPARHARFYRYTARNRVLLARRNLPAPLGVAYLAVWTGLTLARVHDPAALRAWFGGFAEGLGAPRGARRPIRWRTAWRMTRLGRPPIV